MKGWLGKLFERKTAAAKLQRNPIAKAVVEASSQVYAQTPLDTLIDKAEAERLARDYYLEISSICNATDPKTAVREKIAAEMLRFALFQVLVIPQSPAADPSGLRGLCGVSGQLGDYAERLARINLALGEALSEPGSFDEDADIHEVLDIEYWKNFWLLETINAARKQIGDAGNAEDWYQPFRHAACANQENLYRIDLDLPPAFDTAYASSAPTAYSLFTDIVIAGADDPLAEWRDYHEGLFIPEPGKPLPADPESRQTA